MRVFVRRYPPNNTLSSYFSMDFYNGPLQARPVYNAFNHDYAIIAF